MVDSFYNELVRVLDHIKDPHWLGEHSPLAAPYFLGVYLQEQSRQENERAIGRGKALQQLIKISIDHIREHHLEGRYLYELLDEAFFNQKTLAYRVDKVGGNKATYFRHRSSAIKEVEIVLAQRLHPSLRLETPIATHRLVDRAKLADKIIAFLQSGRSVGLTGPGGIGKTALGAQVTKSFTDRPIFWYTIHVGLTDRLNSLLFALAYFLQRHGASDLWLQLVADEGRVNMDIVPGLLRHDLATLKTAPLFCLDEVDLLQPEQAAHAQIISFVESLAGNATFLIMGQRMTVAIAEEIAVPELSSRAIHQLLVTTQDGITLTSENFDRLQSYTAGNPRLLHLFIALHQSGALLDDVLAQMTHAPALENLLNRIWMRLDERHQGLMMELSAYRRPAPSDMFETKEEQFALRQLTERRLVQTDSSGGIFLLPAYRELIFNVCLREVQNRFHLMAASVRAKRGEYTAAAYHCVQGQRIDLAVNLWEAQRNFEINQGQAEAAITLFSAIPSEQLTDPKIRERLVLLRADLHRFLGNYGLGRTELASIRWLTPLLEARAKRLEGDLLELVDDLSAAEQRYKQGLQITQTLYAKELILFRRDLGWVYRRQQQYDQALHETQFGRYEIESLEGRIERAQGNLSAAHTHYTKALEIARGLGDSIGEGKVNNFLGSLCAQQSDFTASVQYWNNAYECFKRIGDQFNMASVRANQAAGAVLAGMPEQAISLATESLTLFDRFGTPHGVAVACQALAEAHFALENLDQAATFVDRVVASEDELTMADALRIGAEIELAKGNYSRCQDYIEQAIQLTEGNNRYIWAYALRTRAKLYLAQNEFVAAKADIAQAVELFLELHLPDEVAKTHELLALIP